MKRCSKLEDYLALFKQKPRFKDREPSLIKMWLNYVTSWTIIFLYAVTINCCINKPILKFVSGAFAIVTVLFLAYSAIYLFMGDDWKHDYVLLPEEEAKRNNAIEAGHKEYPYLLLVKCGTTHAEYLTKEQLHGDYANVFELKCTSYGAHLTPHKHVRVVNNNETSFATASVKDSKEYLKEQLKWNTDWFKCSDEKSKKGEISE